MSEPNPGNPCFGCGGDNPRGMRLVFDRDDVRQRIVGHFSLGSEYQGGAGFIHGGIIATVLDEVMSKVSQLSDVRTVTAELHVQYLKPIHVSEELYVEGFSTRREGRQLYHEGEIRNRSGEVLARGQGRFVVLNPEWLEEQVTSHNGEK
jgi:acyl-coenzyme A thioesterase PaaI-like protein